LKQSDEAKLSKFLKDQGKTEQENMVLRQRLKEIEQRYTKQESDDDEEELEIIKAPSNAVHSAHVKDPQKPSEEIPKETTKTIVKTAIQRITSIPQGSLVLPKKHIYTVGSLLWIWIIFELALLYFSISLSVEPETIWEGLT